MPVPVKTSSNLAAIAGQSRFVIRAKKTQKNWSQKSPRKLTPTAGLVLEEKPSSPYWSTYIQALHEAPTL